MISDFSELDAKHLGSWTSLARRLKQSLNQEDLSGSILGRTRLCQALSRELGCSQLEAEKVLDAMQKRGYLQAPGRAAPRSASDSWRIRETATFPISHP